MDMHLPVFLLIEAVPDPLQAEALNRYLAKVPSVFQAYGAVPVASYDIASQITLAQTKRPSKVQGVSVSKVIAVISFPDRESILALFNAPDYQVLVPDRDLAFKQLAFYIGSEPLEPIQASLND